MPERRRYLPSGMKHASEVYEALIDYGMHQLSGGGWKAVSYIARRTAGFGKPADAVSLNQICRGITARGGRRLDFGTGMSRSSAVRALLEAESKGLISKVRGSRGSTNSYTLNLDGILSQNRTSPESEPSGSCRSEPQVVSKPNTQPSDRFSVVQPSVDNEDIDCPPTNRKKRDSHSGLYSRSPSKCRNYPKLKAALAQYLANSAHPQPKDYPSDRQVVEVMDAAGGASEREVCKCLRYLYHDRGLQPGTDYGPRHYAWFPTVVADYFQKVRVRDEVTDARGSEYWSGDGTKREPGWAGEVADTSL